MCLCTFDFGFYLPYMKIPLYTQAIQFGWRTMWEHKLLWVFGLFAALLGQMGILEFLSQALLASSTYALYPHWLALPTFFQLVYELQPFVFAPHDVMWVGALALLLFGFAVFFIWIAIIAQGALIDNLAHEIKKKKRLDVGASWHTGVKHFWRLFFLHIAKQIIFVLLALGVGYATLNMVIPAITSVGDIFIFLLVFLLSFLVGLVVSFLVIYAAGYIVVDELPFVLAVQRAWILFKDHWVVSLEVACLVLVLNIGFLFALAIGMGVFLYPAVFLWFILILTSVPTLFILGLWIGVLLTTLYIIFLSSLFTVFTTAMWMYVFMEMKEKRIKSLVLYWLSAGRH